MDYLHVLGTGNAMVTKLFNTCSVLKLSNEYFMVDCGGGNGILRQLEKAKIPIEEIRHIFLSHEHCDHMLGIVWMLRGAAAKMLSGKMTGTLTVYCHAQLISSVYTLCDLCIQKKMTALFGSRILFVPVHNGQCLQIIERKFTFFDVLSSKAKQYGFTVGLEQGETLCFTGDEPVNASCEQYVKNADWLLCEAFCLMKDAERFKPYEKHHSTAADAAKLAQRLCVKNLLLWHTEQATLATRKKAYTHEAAQFFKGNIWVPDDIELITLSGT